MKPLLDFRNWLASIRDDRTKRMKYRMNGQIYYRDVQVQEIDGVPHVIIPKKSSRPKQVIPFKEYDVVTKETIKTYITQHNIDLSSPEDYKLLIQYEEETLDGQVLTKYAQLGLGPYTMEARKEMLEKLLEIQKNIIHPNDPHYELISEEEMKAIRKIWFKHGDWEDAIPAIYENVMGHSLDWEMDDRPLFDQEQISDLELLCDQFKVDIKVIKKLITIEKQYAGYKFRRGLTDEIGKALKQDYLHL